MGLGTSFLQMQRVNTVLSATRNLMKPVRLRAGLKGTVKGHEGERYVCKSFCLEIFWLGCCMSVAPTRTFGHHIKELVQAELCQNQ